VARAGRVFDPARRVAGDVAVRRRHIGKQLLHTGCTARAAEGETDVAVAAVMPDGSGARRPIGIASFTARVRPDPLLLKARPQLVAEVALIDAFQNENAVLANLRAGYEGLRPEGTEVPLARLQADNPGQTCRAVVSGREARLQAVTVEDGSHRVAGHLPV